MDMVNSIGKTEKDMQVTIMIYYNQDIMLMTEKKDLEFIIGRIYIKLIWAFGKMESNTVQENILIQRNKINKLNLDYGKKAKELNGLIQKRRL